jgi:hypothetical protein
LIESDNHNDTIIAHAADTIAMEVFDSLHMVAYVTMETMNN